MPPSRRTSSSQPNSNPMRFRPAALSDFGQGLWIAAQVKIPIQRPLGQRNSEVMGQFYPPGVLDRSCTRGLFRRTLHCAYGRRFASRSRHTGLLHKRDRYRARGRRLRTACANRQTCGFEPVRAGSSSRKRQWTEALGYESIAEYRPLKMKKSCHSIVVMGELQARIPAKQAKTASHLTTRRAIIYQA